MELFNPETQKSWTVQEIWDILKSSETSPDDEITEVYIPPKVDEVTDEEDIDDDVVGERFEELEKDVAGTFELHHHPVNLSSVWLLPEEGYPVFYRYFRDRITWYEADAVCQFHHGHLVTIDSAKEFDAVRAYLKELDVANFVWTGLKRNKSKEPFLWPESREMSEREGRWAVEVPKSEEAMCAATDPSADFRWQPIPCSGPTVAAFICQMNVPSWALNEKGCMLTSIPSLTVTFLPDQGAVELISDCGLEGTRRISCKGQANHEEMLRKLACETTQPTETTESSEEIPQSTRHRRGSEPTSTVPNTTPEVSVAVTEEVITTQSQATELSEREITNNAIGLSTERPKVPMSPLMMGKSSGGQVSGRKSITESSSGLKPSTGQPTIGKVSPGAVQEVKTSTGATSAVKATTGPTPPAQTFAGTTPGDKTTRTTSAIKIISEVNLSVGTSLGGKSSTVGKMGPTSGPREVELAVEVKEAGWRKDKRNLSSKPIPPSLRGNSPFVETTTPPPQSPTNNTEETVPLESHEAQGEVPSSSIPPGSHPEMEEYKKNAQDSGEDQEEHTELPTPSQPADLPMSDEPDPPERPNRGRLLVHPQHHSFYAYFLNRVLG